MASTVKLRSQDGEEFVVTETVAMQSVTLKDMIQDNCAGDAIPVANVDGKTLSKIIEYATKHAEEEKEGGAIENWDAEFINVDKDTLYDLLVGADYLEIEGLLNLCLQEVRESGLKKRMTWEEICQVFILPMRIYEPSCVGVPRRKQTLIIGQTAAEFLF